MSLADELRRLRTLKGASLRKVEEETGISNAYLSQLETGKTDKPSPAILHKLADCYNVDYTYLLKVAGYLVKKQKPTASITDVNAALMSANLSDEQEEMLVKFIEFLSKGNSGSG